MIGISGCSTGSAAAAATRGVRLGIWILFCLCLLSGQNAANCFNFYHVKEKGVKGFLSQKIKIQQNAEGVGWSSYKVFHVVFYVEESDPFDFS